MTSGSQTVMMHIGIFQSELDKMSMNLVIKLVTLWWVFIYFFLNFRSCTLCVQEICMHQQCWFRVFVHKQTRVHILESGDLKDGLPSILNMQLTVYHQNID